MDYINFKGKPFSFVFVIEGIYEKPNNYGSTSTYVVGKGKILKENENPKDVERLSEYMFIAPKQIKEQLPNMSLNSLYSIEYLRRETKLNSKGSYSEHVFGKIDLIEV